MKGSVLSPLRTRWTTLENNPGKTLPQLQSKLELPHSQFSNWSCFSAGPQCSEFYCSSKGRMLRQQELLDTRWPFPSHNLSNFPPQQQKHHRKLKPNYTANSSPGFWEAEQHPHPSLLSFVVAGKRQHLIPFSRLCLYHTSVKQLRTAIPFLYGANDTKK